MSTAPPKKNFRLRGIPYHYQTRAAVRELVKTILRIEASASVVVHSLARNPVEQTSKVATLSFQFIPESLCLKSSDEWVFTLPEEQSLKDDDFGRPSSVVFDTHFSSFTPLQRTPDEECYIDVIAISGLNGHAFGSFKERDGSFMWLRDALPLDIPGARILIYGYDTRLIQSNSFQNLSDLGRALQLDIRSIRESNESRPIIFIGHSLGGIVIKEAITNFKADLDEEDAHVLEHTSGFLFFGVPHQGMAIESLVPLVNDYPNRSLLESLNRNSALLRRLENEFSGAFGSKSIRIVSFYETQQSPTALKNNNGEWELSGPHQVLVDVSSATCGSKYQHPINRNHSEIVKYKSQYDEVYTRVRTALRPLMSRAQCQNATVPTETVVPLSLSLSNESLECLRSLSFREQDYRYNEIHSAKDTCQWLLENPKYQAWMNSTRGLFWIKGNPGSGKSVLMKYGVERMRERKMGNFIASFFIHGRGTLSQKSPSGIFRGLLNSMLLSFPDYLLDLTKVFNDKEKRFGSYQEKRWDWTESELQELISAILTKGAKTQPVVIFIDALDECGPSYAKFLLGFFRNLMDDIGRHETRVKICFSSRHYPILGHDYISAIHVEEQNNADIRLVIQQQLKHITPNEKRQQVEKEILLKSQGGFQWAVLIAAKVVEGHAIGIKTERLYEQIRNTPEALDELYTNLLSNATEPERFRMIKLFQWVLFAARPLSAQELREALTTDKDMNFQDISEMRSHESWSDTLVQFEKYIRHLSRGLVEFQTRDLWEQYDPDGDDANREAQFIHQSVADYISENFPGCTIYNDPISQLPICGTGHFEISRSCLKYLTLREILDGAKLSRGLLSAKFPLLPYLIQFIFHHIRMVEQAGIPQHDLPGLIHWGQQSETLGRIVSIFRIMDPDNGHVPRGWPFMGATLLHLLVSFGSKSAVDVFLGHDLEVDRRDSDGNTPTLIALRDGHQGIALGLLNRSIKWRLQNEPDTISDITEKATEEKAKYLVDINTKNEDDETALDFALGLNDPSLIRKLIGAGADLALVGMQSAFISFAITHRDKSLLQKLIEKKFNFDGVVYSITRELINKSSEKALEYFIAELLKAGAKTTRGSTFNSDIEDDSSDSDPDDEWKAEAVHFAVRANAVAVVKLLLSHGAFTNLSEQLKPLPLLKAIDNKNEELVEVLLQNGADVNARQEYGMTPLLHALYSKDDRIINLLLQKGADVNAGTEHDMTPLLHAVIKKDCRIINLLLQNGADVNARQKYGMTPLLRALHGGDDRIINLLLQNGADVNAGLKRVITPLLRDFSDEDSRIIKLLLQRASDIETTLSVPGNIPILWAVKTGEMDILKLLLENGANIASRTENGSTLLRLDLENGHVKMANFLVSEGVDIDPCNSDGWTPLLVAWKLEHDDVADFLIKNGATLQFHKTQFKRIVWQVIERQAIQRLNTLGWDVNATSFHGRTFLQEASENGNKERASLLIKNGANVDFSGPLRDTPLLLAVENSHERIVELLLKNGAKVNLSGYLGRTPLFWKIKNKHSYIIRRLLTYGADASAHDEQGSTPISLASKMGDRMINELLVGHQNDIALL